MNRSDLFDANRFSRQLLQRARGRRLSPEYLDAEREEQWNNEMRRNPVPHYVPEVEPGVPLRCFGVGGMTHQELVGQQMEALMQADRATDAIERAMESASPESMEALAQIRDLIQPNQRARLDILAVHEGGRAKPEDIRSFAESLSRSDPR